MNKILIGVLAALALAACTTNAEAGRRRARRRTHPGRDDTGRRDLRRSHRIGRRDRPGRRDQSAEGSEQHPVQAQRLLRFRCIRDQGRL